MKDKSETGSSVSEHIKAVASTPWCKGPVLGASMMTVVTPALNWTNHKLSQSTAPYRPTMKGAGVYAASAIPNYAVTFVVKERLASYSGIAEKDWRISFASGALAGFFCTPFEAIAQNKQFSSNQSTLQVIKQIYSHHDLRGFFRGALITSLRDGKWAAGYLTAVETLAQVLEKKGFAQWAAYTMSTIVVGGGFGVASVSLHQLRFKKQSGLTTPVVNKSYIEHAVDIFNTEPHASPLRRIGFFFKGGGPRAITTTLAAGTLVALDTVYDSITKPSHR